MVRPFDRLRDRKLTNRSGNGIIFSGNHLRNGHEITSRFRNHLPQPLLIKEEFPRLTKEGDRGWLAVSYFVTIPNMA